MQEMVQVLRAEDYFETYGRNALYNEKQNPADVRKALVDAFRKEIFGLVAMRAKKRFDEIPPEGDPEALRIARNVVRDETKKWKKVVALFEKYAETSGVIKPDDIAVIPEEGNIGFQDGELVARKAEAEDIPEETEGTDDGDEVQT